MGLASRSSGSAPRLVVIAGEERQLGRYELLLRIASGGMASVFLARARGEGGFQRLMAIKRCHRHLGEDESFVAMFLDEARLAALIHHPNVVPVVDVSTHPEPYLVMDYIEGGSLARLLAAATRTAARRLPTGVALRIVYDALSGLHAAHRVCSSDGRPLRLIHRDLSPHNLLVGVDGLTRITDFGVARAEARWQQQTAGDVFKGKAAYASPEQAGQGEVDQRADLFSMGVVLWESLTGRRLFIGNDPSATLHALLHAPIPPPSVVQPEAPRRLDAVVLKALARDPDMRYPTALAFVEALEAAGVSPASHRDVGGMVQGLLAADLARLRTAVQSSSVAPAGPQARSQRRLIVIAAALTLAAAGVLAGLAWSRRGVGVKRTRPAHRSPDAARIPVFPRGAPRDATSAPAKDASSDAPTADSARRLKRHRKRRPGKPHKHLPARTKQEHQQQRPQGKETYEPKEI